MLSILECPAVQPSGSLCQSCDCKLWSKTAETLECSTTYQLEPEALGVVEEEVEGVAVGKAYTGMATGSSLPVVPLWFGSMISGAPLSQTKEKNRAQLRFSFCHFHHHAMHITAKTAIVKLDFSQ